MKNLFLLLTILVSTNLFSQTTVHSENFTSGLGTWVGISVTDPTDVWVNSAGKAQMTGWGGIDDEDWLVSPSINMDNQTNEYFMFDYNDNFSGPLLELYYSVDYNNGGTVFDLQTATWIPITLDLIDINTVSCFSTLMHRHSAIDVSGILGSNVYFAFKYLGASGLSKRYKIDDIHIEADYYGAVNTFLQGGGNCADLKTELFTSIQSITRLCRYTASIYDVWDGMQITDRRSNDANTAQIVYDMFTDFPSTTGEFEFDHCANKDYGSCPAGEGLCYNREHSLPKSWWGGGTAYPSDEQYTDLHHLVPSDRQMNSLKSNYPPGIVTNATTTGTNGFKVGTNPSYPCTAMMYFEPIDEYKGDYARMYFYLATKYEPQIGGWFLLKGDCAIVAGSTYPVYEPWLMTLLLEWHANDPVSVKEIKRNNAVYGVQGNRNPFIDNPEWVGYVWGDNLGNSCSTLAVNCIPTTGIDVISTCSPYQWIDGVTYSVSNSTATFALINASGCDSTVTLNLSITTLVISTTTVSPSITANYNTTGTTYQWIENCGTTNSIVVGEINQTFTANTDGDYGVIITNNTCVDTSVCETINVSGIDDENLIQVLIYPNPNSGKFTVMMQNYSSKTEIKIKPIDGKVIITKQVNSNSTVFDLSTYPKGIYLVQLINENDVITKKISVQ